MFTKQSHTYKAALSCEIQADVYRMPDGVIRPAILWLHGGALIFGDRRTLCPDQYRQRSWRSARVWRSYRGRIGGIAGNKAWAGTLGRERKREMGRGMNRSQVLRALVYLGLIALLLLGCSGPQVGPAASPTSVPPATIPLPRLEGKRALFVVPDRFADVEYSIPRRILEELGAVVTVASWSSDAVMGSAGDAVQPEVELGDVHAGDFDAIVFVGGQGVKPTDPDTQRIVQEAIAEGKVVAAICAAQGILTRAGLREGGRADAVYVERDGRIIAASGPIKAREFGEAIAAALGE